MEKFPFVEKDCLHISMVILWLVIIEYEAHVLMTRCMKLIYLFFGYFHTEENLFLYYFWNSRITAKYRSSGMKREHA